MSHLRLRSQIRQWLLSLELTHLLSASFPVPPSLSHRGIWVLSAQAAYGKAQSGS